MTADADVVAAARELQRATVAVRTLLEKDYPNRRELEAQFIRKSEIKNRFALWLVALLVSAVVSFLGTTATVSYCFLGDTASHPGWCEAIPGYEETLKNNEELVRQFKELQQRSITNEKRITKLEGR